MKHIAIGLLAILLGVCGVIVWWSTFAAVMRGGIPFGLLLFGLVAILSGFRKIVQSEPEEKETAHKKSKAVRKSGKGPVYASE